MRLSVSNLAWPPHDETAMLGLLAREGVRGVEVAPTRIGPWQDTTWTTLKDYRDRLREHGLVVSSLQAICYSKPDLQLLGESFQPFLEHMKRVSDIAWALGARVMVFGAPNNRKMVGPSSRIVDRLGRLGDAIAPAILAIEPVPRSYGCEFLTSWRDVLNVVREVDHPGIRVHLDTACVALNGDGISLAVEMSAPYLAHFHASQPQLGSFDDPLPQHYPAAMALRRIQYDGWVSIEMKEQAAGAVEQAVKTVRRIYDQEFVS